MILVDKPAGMSSFGVVARVRRILREQVGKKVKVGHTGTLDPFATGLMILLTGEKTKESENFLKLDKEYEATLFLGATSTTGDPEGRIEDWKSEMPSDFDWDNPPKRMVSMLPSWVDPKHIPEDMRPFLYIQKAPSRKEVKKVVRSFVGKQEQRVPRFSAVKINGRRAYELARKGVEFETPVREVTIYGIEILDYSYPLLKIRCKVSSGTYIRALAEDIGAALDTGAYLTELRRTQVGEYRIEDAKKLKDIMC